MSTTIVRTPTSLLRYGQARADITPPVGIYHRMWGAARHDRATGVHHPLRADVLALAPLDGHAPPILRVQLDLVGLVRSQYQHLAAHLANAAGLPPERVIITFSHTHAAGWLAPDRMALPGGELIEPYLQSLAEKLATACSAAQHHMRAVAITYGTGRCQLAANRDYWDDEHQLFACGFNPDTPADDTLVVGRVTSDAGIIIGTIVNYACHPTSLAWENTMLSPDYVGATRQVVEGVTGTPCIFLQGACGDLGPRDGLVGDTFVADRNGEQLGFGAVSVLASMAPPELDRQYAGPVVSGATLGTWRFAPFDAARQEETARFTGGSWTVDVPLKPRPDQTALQIERDDWERRYVEADARGDTRAARDARARAERARRWLGRLAELPPGDTFAYRFSAYRLGDAVWITCGGEPYSLLQVALRRRFPKNALLISPLAGDMQVAYLLPADRYGRGLYQEEPSILAPGCLEQVIGAIGDRVEELIGAG